MAGGRRAALRRVSVRAGGQATSARGAAGGRGRGEGRVSVRSGGAGRGSLENAMGAARGEKSWRTSKATQKRDGGKCRACVVAVVGPNPGLAPRWLVANSQAYKGAGVPGGEREW